MKTVKVVAAVIKKDNRIFATERGYGDFKDMWEFPGGKIEPGESGPEALKREIREELDTVIEVGDYIETVEYDYPAFHLSMECYWCTVKEGKLTLLEHENALWLDRDSLLSVEWLPADLVIIPKVKEGLSASF
jgi:8-oxo-dGTP diphosphatase